jgi:hypothetical protein
MDEKIPTIREGLEHVGWQQRFICPEEGPSIWSFCSDEEAEILMRRDNYEVRPVFADRAPN